MSWQAHYVPPRRPAGDGVRWCCRVSTPKRPLSELHPGDPVRATLTSHQPCGITAKLDAYEPAGASLDTIRRGSEPGVRRLVQDLPPVGTTIELVVGAVRLLGAEAVVLDPYNRDRRETRHPQEAASRRVRS